ncbi:DNA repair protein RecO [Robiginitalea sp. IMCC44478]|uniref:DNA repair protein RecO n=1 Tax=Robiginitalea sp. IMCC44478 TaxID=3459122 RepID=UPI0040436258
MSLTTQAIVLSSLKYGDSHLIVKAFTAAYGLQTYMVKGVLKNRRGRLKAAYFQPLTQLELVCSRVKPGKMGYIKEAVVAFPYSSMHTDIYKSTVAFFLSEMLSQSIREEEENPALFTYLQNALQWLDHHHSIANFHIQFLLGLTRYLGFYPDNSNMEAPYFDLVEGAFLDTTPLNPAISGEALGFFKKFLGTNFDAIHTVKMSQKQRQALLKNLVDYFEVHLHGFRKPKSLAVLDEVFS